MGKTRDLFNKIRDTKGTFHAKMGSIKDRNEMEYQQKQKMKEHGKNPQDQIYEEEIGSLCEK